MKASETLSSIEKRLKKAGVPEPDIDARELLEFFCDISYGELIVHPDKEITPEQEYRLEQAVTDREMRIPLQHIIGMTGFMGMDFAVREGVLIPRPDTEILVEEVLKDVHNGFDIIDLCTGTGCIAISLAAYTYDCHIIATDISSDAVELANENADAILDESVRDSLTIAEADLFGDYDGPFDIIVSNPPYIRTEEIAGLEPEVKDHDPMLALDGGVDGLDVYRQIIPGSIKRLRKGGELFLETGCDQAAEVTQLMINEGFVDLDIIKDYSDNDRVVKGRRPGVEV